MLDFKEQTNNNLKDFFLQLEKQRDDIMTIEHYSERYIPMQIQNMIIDNMKVIHEEPIINRLIGHENKLNSRIQDQLNEWFT